MASSLNYFSEGPESSTNAPPFETEDGREFLTLLGYLESHAKSSTVREFNHEYELSSGGPSLEVCIREHLFDEGETNSYIHLTIHGEDWDYEIGDLQAEEAHDAESIFGRIADDQPEDTANWLRMIRAAQGTEDESTIARAAMDNSPPDAIDTQMRLEYLVNFPVHPYINFSRLDRYSEFAEVVTRERAYVHLEVVNSEGTMYSFYWDMNTGVRKMTIETGEHVRAPVFDDDGTYDMALVGPTQDKIQAFNRAIKAFQ